MYKVHLIGVDENGINPKSSELLKGTEIVFSAERHKGFCDLEGKKIYPLSPLNKAMERLKSVIKTQDAVVLASGDPLFFGIGRRLLFCLGSQNVDIYPSLSFIQLAAARFKVPWDDANFISLHGRDGSREYHRMLRLNKTFILTDEKNSPDVIARNLIKIIGETGNLGSWTVYVGENLGLPGERITRGSLLDISKKTFDKLNIMLLVREDKDSSSILPFGLSETEIVHSRGMITKNEVRSVVLHSLRLPQTGVFWDIGAGSGSVGIEAARLFPELQVFAVERSPEQLVNIRENQKKFFTYNLHLIDGEAPEALSPLPHPDRVFIGGSHGKLKEIIDICSERLAKGGRIVINAVTKNTKELAPRLLYETSFNVFISELTVTRYNYPSCEEDKKDFNPISVIVGEK